jgi:hypothetical protein
MAHSDIFVVSAKQDLISARDDFSVSVYTRVDGSLSSAFAHSFDFRDGIGNLKEPVASGEKIGEKVRT